MVRNRNRNIAPTRPIGVGKDNQKLSVVILGSHPRYRMRSYGPTPLFQLKDGTKLIDYQIEVVKNCFPNSEIILVIGFESDRIMKNKPDNCRIVENQLFEDTGEFESIRLGLNNIETDSALIFGATYFTEENLAGITKSGPVALVDHNNTSSVGVNVDSQKILSFSYGFDDTKWLETIYLSGHSLSQYYKIISNIDKTRLFAWEGLNSLIEEKVQIKAVECEDMFVIERLDDKKRLEQI